MSGNIVGKVDVFLRDKKVSESYPHRPGDIYKKKVTIMKTLFFACVIAAALISCDDDDIKITPDPLSGHWEFESSEIEFSFDMYREHGVYKGRNAIVKHESLQPGESDDTLIAFYNRTEAGYEQIHIRFYDDPEYYHIGMYGVRVSGEEMIIDEIRVKMPGTEEFTLTGQVLR